MLALLNIFIKKRNLECGVENRTPCSRLLKINVDYEICSVFVVHLYREDLSKQSSFAISFYFTVTVEEL